jgi:hypothetical protein
MDPIRYVNIASFPTGPEAHLVRNELEAAGIPAQVTGEAAVGAIFYVGSALGGVKLMVAEKDVPAANKILAELQLASTPIDESFEGFDTLDDGESAIDANNDEEVTPDEVNPYRAPRAAESKKLLDEYGEDSTVALVNRIWRSAVFGVVFCPPLLNCYSSFLLLANTELFQQAPPKHKWKLWGAVAFNALVIGLVILMWWSLYLAINNPPYGPPGSNSITEERSWP